MGDRSYGQFCALAKSLDHVGERWTLLIVRELLVGPRRYTDLKRALPGIATNLLADRLRALERDGLIRARRMPPPLSAELYELTELGRGLEPAINALVRWGGTWMGARAPDEVFQPQWLVVALRALLPERIERRIRGSIELRAGDERLQINLGKGRVEVLPGAADHPEIVIQAEPEVLLGVAAGRRSLASAVDEGLATVEGDTERRRGFETVLAHARRD